jgi:hypothetical protein
MGTPPRARGRSSRSPFAPVHAPHDFPNPIRDADAELDVPFVVGQGEVLEFGVELRSR